MKSFLYLSSELSVRDSLWAVKQPDFILKVDRVLLETLSRLWRGRIWWKFLSYDEPCYYFILLSIWNKSRCNIRKHVPEIWMCKPSSIFCSSLCCSVLQGSSQWANLQEDLAVVPFLTQSLTIELPQPTCWAEGRNPLDRHFLDRV